MALLLQAIYGIRSERMLIEQLDYNLLFRWFVVLNPDDLVGHPTTFTLTEAVGRAWRSHWNRERLLYGAHGQIPGAAALQPDPQLQQ